MIARWETRGKKHWYELYQDNLGYYSIMAGCVITFYDVSPTEYPTELVIRASVEVEKPGFYMKGGTQEYRTSRKKTINEINRLHSELGSLFNVTVWQDNQGELKIINNPNLRMNL